MARVLALAFLSVTAGVLLGVWHPHASVQSERFPRPHVLQALATLVKEQLSELAFRMETMVALSQMRMLKLATGLLLAAHSRPPLVTLERPCAQKLEAHCAEAPGPSQLENSVQPLVGAYPRHLWLPQLLEHCASLR